MADREIGPFEEYAAVDWSAASVPRTGPDSIWIAIGSRTWNPPTRAEAEALLVERIARRRGRMLIGFDFSFGYPAGFAAAIGARDWAGVWQEIARRITDRDDNSNDRFEAAAAWNREITGRDAPFWGCPRAAAGRFLSMRKPALPPDIAEFREIDRLFPGIHSPWKLYTAGAVGSQMLMGIPRVLRLRERTPRSAVWPFEDWRRADVVFAEIYPSIVPMPAHPPQPKDKAQVLASARWMETLRAANLDGPSHPLEGALLQNEKALPKERRHRKG